MRKVFLVIALVIVGGITGCMNLQDVHQEGIVSIRIHPKTEFSSGITTKFIPPSAEKVRLRIWNPDTGFNTVATAPIGDDQLNIAVPRGDKYHVDAVSYFVKNNRALALTGGSTTNVSVKANETTSIQLALRPWHTEVDGDQRVKPNDVYAVRFVATDGGGLITRETFKSASLHASATSFQDSDETLPSEPGIHGILSDDNIAFSATAPNVSVETSFFLDCLVEFTQNWNDTSLENVDEQTIFLELPNRHLGEQLYQLIVDPSQGGILIDISSALWSR